MICFTFFAFTCSFEDVILGPFKLLGKLRFRLLFTSLQGPVVPKSINANPRLKINQGVLFLHSQMLFNADIWQNFTLEEFNLEKENKQ